MGGTESNVSRDANISGTHTHVSKLQPGTSAHFVSTHLTATELLYLYEALSPGSI